MTESEHIVVMLEESMIEDELGINEVAITDEDTSDDSEAIITIAYTDGSDNFSEGDVKVSLGQDSFIIEWA
jgi:hypothetical protein